MLGYATILVLFTMVHILDCKYLKADLVTKNPELPDETAGIIVTASLPALCGIKQYRVRRAQTVSTKHNEMLGNVPVK